MPPSPYKRSAFYHPHPAPSSTPPCRRVRLPDTMRPSPCPCHHATKPYDATALSPRHHATAPLRSILPRHRTTVMKMSLGEKAELTCPGDYAYGELGTRHCSPSSSTAPQHLPKHPPTDTLTPAPNRTGRHCRRDPTERDAGVRGRIACHRRRGCAQEKRRVRHMLNGPLQAWRCAAARVWVR